MRHAESGGFLAFFRQKKIIGYVLTIVKYQTRKKQQTRHRLLISDFNFCRVCRQEILALKP